MAADRTVKVNFIGDAGSLKRASDTVSASLSKVGDSVRSAGEATTSHLSKMGSALGGFAKAASVGLLAGTAGLAVFGKGAVSAASGLAESLGKSNVVFGAQAKEIEAWAGTASRAFGQSKQQALEAAGTYGNLFQAFGVGREQSAKMSTSLVQLAADLASFNNTSVDDALEALRSGLSGETEPLKKYGVALSDDRLKLEAVRLGLIKTTKEGLTPAAKAQASYSLIMKDTVLAQGDFARTSDGLANRTRILKARFADIQAEIGTKLLPIVVKLAGFMLDKVLPTFEKVGAGVSRALREIKNGFDGGVKATGFIGALQRIGDVARDAFESVRRGVAGFLEAFRSVNSTGEWEAHGRIEAIGVIAAKVFGWLKENGPKIFAVLKDAGEVALRAIGTAFEKVGDILKNDVWPAIKTVADFMLDHKETLVGVAVAIGVAFGVWAINAAAAAAATALAAAPFVLLAVGIGAAVAGIIYAYKHFERFRNIVDATGRFMRDKLLPAAITAGKGIASAFQTGVAFFKDTFLPAVVSVAKWLSEQLGPAFKAVSGFVTGSLIPALKDVVGWFNKHRAVAIALAAVLVSAFLGPIAAIGAFVAGIIYAYKHSEKVRAVLDTVGRVLRDKVAPAIKVAIEWYIKFVTAMIKVEIALAKVYIAVARFAVKVATAVAPAVAAVIGWIIKFNVWLTKIEITVVKVAIKVVEFGVRVVKAFIDVAKAVGEKVGQIIGFILGIGSKIAGFAVGLFDGIKDAISTAKDWVGDRIGEVVGFFKGLGGRIADGAGDVFGFIKDAITATKDWVSDKVDDIVGFFKGLGSRIGAFASDLFYDVKFAIVVAKNFVSDKVDDILGFFKNLPGHIADFMGGLADTISSPFKSAFNDIARFWNSTVGSLSFKVPDWIPGLGGKGWDVPDIPTFDVGGVVKGVKGAPVLALVHAGETILPTHKMSATRAIAQVSKSSGGAATQGVLAAIARRLFGSVKVPQFDSGGVVGGGTLTATPTVVNRGGSSSRTIVVDMRGAHITGVTDFKKAVKEAVIAGSRADGGWNVSLRSAS